ncbi:hypothetical protein [Oricola cellulosilytica]|uniref:Uncharacterized protein n=1 Tax=Oricola cellulosilytica TaxID=1429082 RepID=A0A4R0PAC0_9HYPH|nr:hypothetical protein [Oricola cellulosilytica]TCD13192.1 hypothetical protein E0D97_14420 [Oricola cellulosilytica]
MVSLIASSTSVRISYQTPQPAVEPLQSGKGKSGESVGHMAKAAIADANNPDLPSNIQGKVASAIARFGSDVDLSPLLAPAPPEDAPTDGPETAIEPVSGAGDPIPPGETGETSGNDVGAAGNTSDPAGAEEAAADGQSGTEPELVTALSTLYSENAASTDPIAGIEQLLDDLP